MDALLIVFACLLAPFRPDPHPGPVPTGVAQDRPATVEYFDIQSRRVGSARVTAGTKEGHRP